MSSITSLAVQNKAVSNVCVHVCVIQMSLCMMVSILIVSVLGGLGVSVLRCHVHTVEKEVVYSSSEVVLLVVRDVP